MAVVDMLNDSKCFKASLKKLSLKDNNTRLGAMGLTLANEHSSRHLFSHLNTGAAAKANNSPQKNHWKRGSEYGLDLQGRQLILDYRD